MTLGTFPPTFGSYIFPKVLPVFQRYLLDNGYGCHGSLVIRSSSPWRRFLHQAVFCSLTRWTGSGNGTMLKCKVVGLTEFRTTSSRPPGTEQKTAFNSSLAQITPSPKSCFFVFQHSHLGHRACSEGLWPMKAMRPVR